MAVLNGVKNNTMGNARTGGDDRILFVRALTERTPKKKCRTFFVKLIFAVLPNNDPRSAGTFRIGGDAKL